MIYIKDEEFIRGNCPMTKEEVRILSIAKLEIEDNFNMIDIGAGTGSLSIQMSKICRNGKVVAIERDEEALEVLQKNKGKFEAFNMEIAKGEAVDILKEIEGSFDGIFIGGSGGNIESIINESHKKLKTGRKMVLNFITVENLYKAVNTLRELKYETECIQISVNKAKGKSLMMTSNNSIFIVSGRKA